MVAKKIGIVNATKTFTQVSLCFSTGITTIDPFNNDGVNLENLQFRSYRFLPPYGSSPAPSQIGGENLAPEVNHTVSDSISL